MPGPVIYAGTFDPVTYGHIDLIKRALKLFDRVVVAVAHNPQKHPLFTVHERVALLREVTRGLRGVSIDAFDSLVVDYVIKKRARVVIRGLRMLSDFEYEFQMALTNRKLDNDIATVFLMPHEKYTYLSSSLIREQSLLSRHYVVMFWSVFTCRTL